MSFSSRKQKGKDSSCSKKLKLKFKHATDNEKALIINAFNFVTKTWPDVDEVAMVAKTSAICGISFKTVYKVLTEHKEKLDEEAAKAKRADILNQLDDGAKCRIRQKINNFHYNGELPFVEKVFEALNDDDSLPNFSMKSMHRVLKHLQFMCIIKKSLVTDTLKMVLARCHYLRDIKRFRKENRRIFYLDEAWVKAGPTVEKTGTDQSGVLASQYKSKASTSKIKRIIMAHIGNEESGFVEGGEWITESTSNYEFEDIMDASDFEMWFKKILGLLQPNDVIVMDNASYHWGLTKTPNMFGCKKDFQDWLKSKRIPFDERDTLTMLVEKLKFIATIYEFHATDEMAKAKGIQVLRIPLYHCGLNPFELIWPEVKDYVARHITLKSDVKKLVKEGLAQITSNKWKQCVERVIQEEEKMRGLDRQIDSIVDPYVELHKTTLANESTESSESAYLSTASESDRSESESNSSESELDSSESEYEIPESELERKILRENDKRAVVPTVGPISDTDYLEDTTLNKINKEPSNEHSPSGSCVAL